MFKGLRGVLMFSLCFLSSTKKVSGDGRKNSHEREITETDRGRGRGRESDRNTSLVINACAIVCSVSLPARTKAEERRQVMHTNRVLRGL